MSHSLSQSVDCYKGKRIWGVPRPQTATTPPITKTTVVSRVKKKYNAPRNAHYISFTIYPMVTQLTSSTFQAFITKNRVAVVDFYADWCGPCKIIGPILDELSNELTTTSFGKVNADDEGVLAGQFNISSIPTVLIFKNGSPVNQLVGAMSKDAFKRAFEAAHAS